MLKISWCLRSMGQKKKNKNPPLFQSEYVCHNCFFLEVNLFASSFFFLYLIPFARESIISGLKCFFTKKKNPDLLEL